MRDFEDDEHVNKQLEKMCAFLALCSFFTGGFFFHPRGYNIGLRLIDDFLANSGITTKCQDFHETADVIAKVSMLFECFLYRKKFIYSLS